MDPSVSHIVVRVCKVSRSTDSFHFISFRSLARSVSFRSVSFCVSTESDNDENDIDVGAVCARGSVGGGIVVDDDGDASVCSTRVVESRNAGLFADDDDESSRTIVRVVVER